jgi:glucose-6-phosphate isomerase
MDMKIEFHNCEALEGKMKRSFLELRENNIINRILRKDYSIWKDRNEEITTRLGWLESPIRMKPLLEEYAQEAEAIRKAGIKQIVLLGMGGSSLAPEAISKILPQKQGYPRFIALDSTCPSAISQVAEMTKNKTTLFLVSSKSGTTAETLSFFNYFYRQQTEIHGSKAGRYFMAITDPGTLLEKLASELGFRRTIPGFPDVGGRFSALSPFGLFPAALMGIDVRKLLIPAEESITRLKKEPYEHPGVKIGASLGALARLGKDKLTLILPAALKSFGRWLEQLIAESTGKEGQSLLPVIESLPQSEDCYSQDRAFVFYGLGSDQNFFGQEKLEKFIKLKFPLIYFSFSPEDISEHFFSWELAIALAGYFMKINPFNQPDVELTKKKTRELLSKSQKEPSSKTLLDLENDNFQQEFKSFLLKKDHTAEYIALLSFLPPDDSLEVALDNLARQLTEKTHLPATWNYGPAYLHSTGQLHKGDAGKGKFIGLVFQEEKEVTIPSLLGSPAIASSFNLLFEAQALADFEALREKGRAVFSIRIKDRPVEKIFRLSELVRNS